MREAKRSSFDYYSFVRNAYLQRRRALVTDTATPGVEQQEELYYIPGDANPNPTPEQK